MSKSHVGMELCFWCNEPKGILLDKNLKDTLEEKAIYNCDPCDKCLEKWQKDLQS